MYTMLAAIAFAFLKSEFEHLTRMILTRSQSEIFCN